LEVAAVPICVAGDQRDRVALFAEAMATDMPRPGPTPSTRVTGAEVEVILNLVPEVEYHLNLARIAW
jgi:hypothetical protein